MDTEDIELYLEMAQEGMEKAISHLQTELQRIRTGKASGSMLENVMVPYYGVPTPLAQVANLGTADARTITIQPYEKKVLSAIEKAIFESGLGLTPQNDGQLIRINIPPLTEERRREFVKRAKAAGEDSKVGIRNARRDAMEGIKKEVKNGYPEDAGKRKEIEVQTLTDKYSAKVEDMLTQKEKEIMTV